MIALVLAMIVAVPLLAAPADYSQTGVATLTLETFALALLGMMLWRARPDLRGPSLGLFARTGANVPVLLLLGWTALSCWLSPHKAFSIQALLQAGAGALLYFAVAYQFRQSKHLSMLADVLLFLSLAVSLGSLAQFQAAAQERAQAPFGDSQALASFTVLLLPLVASLAFVDARPRRQAVAQLTFVLMIGSLLLAQGRGAWLSTLVSLSTFAALSWRLSRSDRSTQGLSLGSAQGSGSEPGSLRGGLSARKHLLVMPALMSVLALGFVVAMNSQNSSIAGRASTITASGLGRDQSFQTRVRKHWKGSVEMISQRPMLGWGAGLYPVYQHRYTGFGAVIAPGGGGQRVSIAEQAHNYYLQTAVELGLPGLALAASILAAFWASAWRRLPQMDAGIRRTLLLGSLAGTVGFAIDALSSPAWQFAQTSMFLWLCLGLGTSCLRPRPRREREREEEAAPVASHALSRRAARSMRPVAVGACLTVATLLPTTFVSAQTFDYNPPSDNGGTSAAEVAFGVAAVSALAYAIYAFTSGGAAGGAAAGGATAGGAAAGDPAPPAPVR